MTIVEWMERKKVSPKQLAEIAGCSTSMVYQVLGGTKKFRPDKLKKIIEASGGKVTFTSEYGG